MLNQLNQANHQEEQPNFTKVYGKFKLTNEGRLKT